VTDIRYAGHSARKAEFYIPVARRYGPRHRRSTAETIEAMKSARRYRERVTGTWGALWKFYYNFYYGPLAGLRKALNTNFWKFRAPSPPTQAIWGVVSHTAASRCFGCSALLYWADIPPQEGQSITCPTCGRVQTFLSSTGSCSSAEDVLQHDDE
jgi:hypothetical protein